MLISEIINIFSLDCTTELVMRLDLNLDQSPYFKSFVLIEQFGGCCQGAQAFITAFTPGPPIAGILTQVREALGRIKLSIISQVSFLSRGIKSGNFHTQLV